MPAPKHRKEMDAVEGPLSLAYAPRHVKPDTAESVTFSIRDLMQDTFTGNPYRGRG